jgi:hypothetical protein
MLDSVQSKPAMGDPLYLMLALPALCDRPLGRLERSRQVPAPHLDNRHRLGAIGTLTFMPSLNGVFGRMSCNALNRPRTSISNCYGTRLRAGPFFR